jgi:hypothetical protein
MSKSCSMLCDVLSPVAASELHRMLNNTSLSATKTFFVLILVVPFFLIVLFSLFVGFFFYIRGVHSSQFGLNLGLNLRSDFDKAHPNLYF